MCYIRGSLNFFNRKSTISKIHMITSSNRHETNYDLLKKIYNYIYDIQTNIRFYITNSRLGPTLSYNMRGSRETG